MGTVLIIFKGRCQEIERGRGKEEEEEEEEKRKKIGRAHV